MFREDSLNQEKKLGLTSLNCPGQEIWLGDSCKLISVDQLRFLISQNPGELKNV